jgi:hypothetical protein
MELVLVILVFGAVIAALEWKKLVGYHFPTLAGRIDKMRRERFIRLTIVQVRDSQKEDGTRNMLILNNLESYVRRNLPRALPERFRPTLGGTMDERDEFVFGLDTSREHHVAESCRAIRAAVPSAFR